MIVPVFSVVLLASAGLASATSPYNVHARGLDLVPRQNNNGGGNRGGNNGDPANVQEASQATGQEGGAEAGQADSATDDANFINFCTGKTLTNGLQVQAGSCNGIVMGDIPSTANMVSSIIINPQPGQDLQPDTAFTVQVQVDNLAAGSFTNPANTYYAAPQTLNGGIIVGHTHVTVQDLGGSLTPTAAPNADDFIFFKGINDAGNGNGLLEAEVADGLPAGFYRICTMASASNHQPVIMPIAQRGAQDDCTKFTVGQGNAGGNNNAGNNAGNNNNQEGMPDMNPQYELPPEVAVEIAGYIRSGLFAPLATNIGRLTSECEENLCGVKDGLQDTQSQISNIIEPTAERLVPIAMELKNVYRQIDLLEVLISRISTTIKITSAKLDSTENLPLSGHP
ncbi:unnamed protein product [Tuber melanosporum]|uniref:(Perigord truffle) hypothetical protein n=1 Tax=Tuber melanosporum (strain Mel28) TaxID=656061 RepID=D5GDP1_TUBMM|nr:uncharacterized protein GSTUM_00006207001 [Tuber melanosporum]CAZ82634.1 unnamed protein product [Tuber melanosporum]